MPRALAGDRRCAIRAAAEPESVVSDLPPQARAGSRRSCERPPCDEQMQRLRSSSVQRKSPSRLRFRPPNQETFRRTVRASRWGFALLALRARRSPHTTRTGRPDSRSAGRYLPQIAHDADAGVTDTTTARQAGALLNRSGRPCARRPSCARVRAPVLHRTGGPHGASLSSRPSRSRSRCTRGRRHA